MSEQPRGGEDAPRIAWQTAEVSDGELRVALEGELPKHWGRRFSELLDRLSQGEERWGSVKVAKGRISVREVSEGCEGDLRHQLESALRQANADLGALDTDASTQTREQDAQAQRDERMTAAFRDFAD